MERCWILIGMMGVGKSAVGRSLAVRSGRAFLDTDLMLQHKLGRPVSQLFQIYGESTFRQHETSLLRSLEPSDSVLSTGGGIITTPENWPELRRLGRVVYLKATPEELIDRLATSKKRRPLLEVENWPDRVRALLEIREPMYQQADAVVELRGDDIDSAAERVLEVFEQVPE